MRLLASRCLKSVHPTQPVPFALSQHSWPEELLGVGPTVYTAAFCDLFCKLGDELIQIKGFLYVAENLRGLSNTFSS